MGLFSKNVELNKMPLSSWRKIALGSWGHPSDPSVYGIIEIDATKLLAKQKQALSKPPTITAIVARATALVLNAYPQINGMIRWGRLYQRKNVTLFLQTSVDEAGQELSGVVIHEAQTKSLQAIGAELAAKASAIREDRDPAFKKAKSTFKLVPPFLMRRILNFISFLLYTLNLDLRWLGLPKDPFGSVMITSIGSLGMDEAFGPLVGYSRVPLLLAVGAVKERPAVRDGKIVVAPLFKICVTFDHRFIDGVLGAKMVKAVTRLLETDEGLNEIGL